MRFVLSTLLSLAIAAPALAATRVPADAVEARIAAAIATRAPAPGHYRVTLSDQDFQLLLPDNAVGKWQIANLVFSPAEQAFRATLGFVNDLGNAEIVNISGSAWPVVPVPALSHDMLEGETVTQADLAEVEVPAARLSSNVITSAGALLGQVTRRTLRAQSPLFSYDVTKPILVKKGDLITITFQVPGIQLSAQGQAQSNAAKGDTLAVMNTTSKRLVEARVTGPGTAVISAPQATFAAASN